MTPGMYITTVICLTVIAVAAIIFFSPTPNNNKDTKDDTKKGK